MKNLIKIIFSLAILYLILNVNADAQTVTWQKWYDYKNYEENGQDVIQTFDGGYSILSNNYIPVNNSSVLTKVDQYGNVQWQKLFDRNNVGGLTLKSAAITQTSDSGYVISGGNRDSTFLLKTDKNGNIIWIKKYSRSGYQGAFFSDHKITNDGGIIACGKLYGSSSVGYLVKTDSKGILEWDSIYNFTTHLLNVIESNDNFFYLLGLGTKVTKISNTGVVIWKKNFQLENTVDIVEDKSGGIFIGGGLDSMNLVKLDTSGNIIFNYGYFGETIGIFSMCLSKEGNILLVGQITFPINFDMAVSKVDPLGNLIYNKVIPFTDQSSYDFSSNAVNYTSDYGFIITGITNYPPTFHESNIFVTKTDSLCNAPLNVGISNNNTSIPDQIILYQNYPNPFNPVTKISYEITKSGLIQISVFDINGKLINVLVNEFIGSGKYEITFDSKDLNLPSGIYFYKIEAGDFKQVKKMMLIK